MNTRSTKQIPITEQGIRLQLATNIFFKLGKQKMVEYYFNVLREIAQDEVKVLA